MFIKKLSKHGIGDSPLSIDDKALSKNDFVVFPNPTNNIVTIENKKNATVSNLTLVDANGRVLDFNEIGSQANTIPFSLTTYSAGIYFLKINTEYGLVVKRIIKQ